MIRQVESPFIYEIEKSMSKRRENDVTWSKAYACTSIGYSLLAFTTALSAPWMLGMALTSVGLGYSIKATLKWNDGTEQAKRVMWIREELRNDYPSMDIQKAEEIAFDIFKNNPEDVERCYNSKTPIQVLLNLTKSKNEAFGEKPKNTLYPHQLIQKKPQPSEKSFFSIPDFF